MDATYKKRCSYVSLNRLLATVFVFCLPLRMLTMFNGLTDVFGAQAEYFDYLIHVLGIAVYLISRKGVIAYSYKTKNDKILSFFCKMVAWFAISSLIMTVIVFAEYGSFNGANPWIASTKISLDFLQYMLIFMYCKIVFRVLSIREIERILHTEIIVLLILGYMQVALAIGKGAGIEWIYDFIKNTFNLSHIKYSRGVCLTLIEPSHAAMLIGVIVIPFYISHVLYRDKLYIKEFVEFMLWIPVILMTQSTTIYLMFCVELFVSFFLYVRGRKVNIVLKITVVVLLISLIYIIINPEVVDSIFGIDFSYLFMGKLTDTGNQSTNSRMSILLANLNIFKRYPLIGCGNGLQGYFYRDYAYLLDGKLVDEAVDTLFRGSAASIANGALFIPALLSGYGIVGVSMFVVFIYKCIKVMRINRERYDFLYYFYLVALTGIITAGFKSEFVGIYYVWFVLSIPLVNLVDKRCENGSE